MEYQLETVEDKLTFVKVRLYELRNEQQDKQNIAMSYVLDHLGMIIDGAMTQIRHSED